MAIEITQTFHVAVPPEAVWNFMMNPANVVACMPGASLTEIVDEKKFIGSVKVKIGAVTAQYQGTITYLEADHATGTVRMLAEGVERGGGTVRGTIISQLSSGPGGAGTEVRCRASLDLTGRIVQVGRGMIEGVSSQIIKMYVANVGSMLESQEIGRRAAQATAAGRPQAAAPPRREDSINVVAMVLRTLWERFSGTCRRLFRRD